MIVSTNTVQAAIIFSDNYETADYSAWTGVVENSGSTMGISSAVTYEGTYAGRCSLNYSWRTFAFAYYNFASESILYHKEYIQISGLEFAKNLIGNDISFSII